MSYDLTQNKYFDICEPRHFPYIKAHKRAQIKNCAGFVQVDYDSTNSLTSSGIRICFKTIPGKKYKFLVEGYLFPIEITENKGEKPRAFIYCESEPKPNTSNMTSVRLIPREFYFYPDIPKRYELTFTAVSSETYCGVLFFTKDADYRLEITEFTVSNY